MVIYKMWIYLFIGTCFVQPILGTWVQSKDYYRNESLAADVIHRSRRQSTCGSDQWECRSGSCISLDNLCDGAFNCGDRSDETDPFCTKLGSAKPGGCVLPPYPTYGTYSVSKYPNARPGQALHSFVLRMVCRRGFGIVDSQGGEGSDFQQLYCVNGDYQYENMPKCVRFCILNPDPSVRYMCHVPGVGFKICNNYVAPGTLVKPICNRPIYYSTESLPYMTCNYGFWDQVVQCRADCGRVTPVSSPLVIDGKEAKRGELPWHAGVYRKTSTPYLQICGGSLITNNVVISAAHCFWRVNKIQPATMYAVAIGKLYRDWDSDNDGGAQKSDVKEIRTPLLFQGSAANYQEDIAALILKTPFIYMTYIRPVCIYYDADFERYQLNEANSGKVAGWGLTSSNGVPAETLQVLEMPFIPAEKCIKALPLSFREYITGDKFCAGYTTGKALCKGDSGSGLSFPDRGQGIDRYYLRGIVSTAPRDDDKVCNNFVYTAFTKITKHQDFINEVLAVSAVKKCPLYAFQCDDGSCVDQGADCNGIPECADGSDETEALCKPGAKPEPAPLSISSPQVSSSPAPSTTSASSPVANSGTKPSVSNCVLPEYPDHGTYKTNYPLSKPGQSYGSVTLTFKCRQGYGVMTSKGLIDSVAEVQCDKGIWYQNTPKCIRYCKLPPDPSVRYRCKPPEGGSIKCFEYVSDGVLVTATCNTPDYYTDTNLPIMRCISGSWDYVARCKLECGRETAQSSVRQDSQTFGMVGERGNVPWHVGIHRINVRPYTQVCGGSIVSQNIVISAAHCFWSGKLLPASDFAVAAGKIYRAWSDMRDQDAQKSDIKEIHVPTRFQGSIEDIALLVLVTPFVYKVSVRPVCLDFDYKFDRRQLQDGSIGKVAGWGQTSQDTNYSPVLKIVQLPYVDVSKCIQSMNITEDQFCTQSPNGTPILCDGYDGGGLAFPASKQLDIERYYLRGVVTSTTNQESLCPGSFNSYTSILKHEDIIKRVLLGSL